MNSRQEEREFLLLRFVLSLAFMFRLRHNIRKCVSVKISLLAKSVKFARSKAFYFIFRDKSRNLSQVHCFKIYNILILITNTLGNRKFVR
jgi:hypothetical protein